MSVVRCLASRGCFDSNPPFYHLSRLSLLSLLLLRSSSSLSLSFCVCSFYFLSVSVFFLRSRFVVDVVVVGLVMAVELMMGYRNECFPTKMESKLVQEAASAGLDNMERLVRMLSQQQQQTPSNGKAVVEMEKDCAAVADEAVTKFKKVISLLGRTRIGHARFRRAPVPSPQQVAEKPLEPEREKQKEKQKEKEKESSSSRVYCPTPIDPTSAAAFPSASPTSTFESSAPSSSPAWDCEERWEGTSTELLIACSVQGELVRLLSDWRHRYQVSIGFFGFPDCESVAGLFWGKAASVNLFLEAQVRLEI